MRKTVAVKKKNQLIARNEALLLQLVRSHPGISRIELSSKMGIAPSTIGIFTARLIDEGFLVESSSVKVRKGRPRTALSLNPEGGCLLGVDIEATRIRAVRLDFQEEIQASLSVRTNPEQGADEILQQASDAILQILPPKGKRILGLGIAAPGLLDEEQKTGIFYQHILGWERVPLYSFFRKQFKFPVYIENTLRSAASAELWFGQGKAVDQFVTMVVRSGIGAGIVINGQICRGAYQTAGEIGLWQCPSVVLNRKLLRQIYGTVPACVGMEEIASVRGLLRNAARCLEAGAPSRLKAASLSLDGILDAARQGDPLATVLLDAMADALGWATSQICILLNPRKIIFSGVLAASLGHPFIDRIRKRMDHLLKGQHLWAPELVCSELGEFSGAVGAAAQIVHHWTPPR